MPGRRTRARPQLALLRSDRRHSGTPQDTSTNSGCYTLDQSIYVDVDNIIIIINMQYLLFVSIDIVKALFRRIYVTE